MSILWQLADNRIDELNVFRSRIEEYAITENGKKKYDRDGLLEMFFDFLIMAYDNGVSEANKQLGTSEETDFDRAVEVLDKKVADKTYKERVIEHADKGDTEALIKVLETEGTRDFNQGELQVGNKHAKEKVWHTMLDDRVRDTHDYLEGVSVPIDALFYTYDGDSANAPGDFVMAENNINCRCFLTFK